MHSNEGRRWGTSAKKSVPAQPREIHSRLIRGSVTSPYRAALFSPHVIYLLLLKTVITFFAMITEKTANMTCANRKFVSRLSDRRAKQTNPHVRPMHLLHDEPMSVIFSHATAWAIYHAPNRPSVMPSFPACPAPLGRSYPAKGDIACARSLLELCGIPTESLKQLDVLVADESLRSDDPKVVSHVCSRELPAGSVCRLAPGTFVVSPEICFIQMGMIFEDIRELVEFGFELCGSYELDVVPDGDYRERPALATCDSIAAIIDSMTGMRGVAVARKALRYVREGARSPMETAHIMTLVLPRCMGGAGISAVCMNHRIDIPFELQGLTRRRSVICDGCIPERLLDFEYNGFWHDEEERRVEDEDRRNVLEAMGYRVKVLNRFAFFNCFAFRRHLRSIFQILRIREEKLPNGFWARQEELRRFVLRRLL